MDKCNHKFTILYKWIMANTSAIWQHMPHIPPTKSPNHSKTTPKSQTKEPTFRKMDVYGKRSQAGPKAEKDKTERATWLRQKNKRGDTEKWDQTDSPEIPDRGWGGDIINPWLPFGEKKRRHIYMSSHSLAVTDWSHNVWWDVTSRPGTELLNNDHHKLWIQFNCQSATSSSNGQVSMVGWRKGGNEICNTCVN